MSETYRTTVDPSAANNPHAFALAMVGGGKRVLEVGCSVGHVTQRLVEAGNTVVGVEIDPTAASQAAPHLLRTHVIDLEQIKLSSVEEESFDVLLLGDVLEHFRDPAAVLADLLTRLTERGTVVASVPHVGHIDVRLMLLEGAWEYQSDGLLDRTHVRWYTREGLRAVLADAGLVATRVERVRVPLGATNVPCHPQRHSDEVLDFVRGDPEWDTYQFVLTAERAAGQPDALAGRPPSWADAKGESPGSRLRDLETRNAALQSELDAWQSTKLVRLTSPLRRAYGAVRRRLAR